jgi:hypothetical protein
MRRLIRFTFLLNEEERRDIDRLAGRFQRSRSDMIRALVRAGLEAVEAKPNTVSNGSEIGKGKSCE